jgi:uncharacterized protein (UPF0335 family)
MEDKYLKELNIEEKEILANTPIEEVVDYYFQLLVNANIRKLNNKIDQKVVKQDIKDAGLDTTNFTAAVKLHTLEKENKKLLDGEIIEDYLTKLRNGSDEFSGLDDSFIMVVEREDEIKDEEKNIEDLVKGTGADVKALRKVVKQFVEDLNPNKKPPKLDIVLDGTVESYDKILLDTKKEVIRIIRDIK